jgi:hypothetical protein
MFSVRDYAGKCLDYGSPWQGGGPTVFLNDCTAAHVIGVEEINSRHEVILHAGSQVIGIHNPPVSTLGGAAPPPPTEYALELQPYNPSLSTRLTSVLRWMATASYSRAAGRASVTTTVPRTKVSQYVRRPRRNWWFRSRTRAARMVRLSL